MTLTCSLLSQWKNSWNSCQDLAYSYIFPFTLETLDKILFFLASHKLLEFLDSILGKSLIKSVKSCKTNINFVYKYFAVVRTTSYTIILWSIEYRTTQSSEFQNVIAWLVARKAGTAKSGISGTLIKLQLASVFVCFHSLLLVHLLNFLARSCKILQIRGFLGKNLGKILTKKFRNIQDSYQELQEFLHWDATEIILHWFSGKIDSALFAFKIITAA